MRLINAARAEESVVQLVVAQMNPEHAFGNGEDVARAEVMRRLFVRDRLDAVGGELEDARVRVGHEDGRMRGHDELRAFANLVMNPGKDRQLARGSELLNIGDLILTEVLQGFGSQRDFDQARKRLTGLDAVDIGGQDIAIQSARNYRALRERGITIRKTIDTLIATRCIESDYALL